MGELPEQLETNLRLMERLQTQMDARQEALRGVKNRLIIVESQIKGNKITMRTENTATLTEESDTEWNLAQLKQQLAALQTSYTERHPDVVQLKIGRASCRERV